MVLPNIDNGYSKQYLLDNGLQQQPHGAVLQLFDLVFDPAERNNLVDDPKYSRILKDLKNRLDSWMERTNDPLLKGPVPMPQGATVNRREGLHPEDKDYI
jgi:hypothetical protein